MKTIKILNWISYLFFIAAISYGLTEQPYAVGVMILGFIAFILIQATLIFMSRKFDKVKKKVAELVKLDSNFLLNFITPAEDGAAKKDMRAKITDHLSMLKDNYCHLKLEKSDAKDLAKRIELWEKILKEKFMEKMKIKQR